MEKGYSSPSNCDSIEVTVKLREHPLISYRGLPSWPPVWGRLEGNHGPERLSGEIGVLRRVKVNELVSKKCFLTIEQEGAMYMGCLLFAEQSFCLQIAQLLQGYYGHSIEEIGGLDIGETL